MKIKKRNIPVCASCIGMEFNKPVLSSDEKLPSWLEDFNYVQDFIKKQKEFKIKKNKNTFKVTLHVGKEHFNKFVLYWASKPSKHHLKILDAKKAYGSFENSGISKVNKDGILHIYIQCPQNYKTIISGETHEDTFYRHVHFLFQKEKKEWDIDKIYTKVINCFLPMEKSSFSQGILLNTLPKEEFEKEHIPHSHHLDFQKIKKLSSEQLHFFFQDLIDKFYPKIKKALDNGDLVPYNIPLILYCKNKKCNLSDKAQEILYKKGFVNIKILKDGIDGYKKKFK